MLSSLTFVVVVISLLQIYGEACRSSCEETQFECESGDCITKTWVCDGDRDCAEGEDEKEDCYCRSSPPSIANMASYKVYYYGSSQDHPPYYIRATVRYECKTGYTPEGSSPRCIRRSWSNERPTCVRCEGEPPSIANMAWYKVYHGTSWYSSAPYYVGARVRYECKTGYTLEGSSPRCIGRSWSNERPTCVGCEGEPPSIENMASYKVYYGISPYYSAPYHVGSRVQYECKTGYTLEGSSPRCIRRSWSNERPTCVEMCQDEPPSIDHMAGYKVLEFNQALGRDFRHYRAPYKSGSSVKYVCDFEFKFEGFSPICRNGRWSGDKPKCVPAVDFATCGQGGEVRRELYRVNDPDTTAKYAWPWQVLITMKSNNASMSLSDDNVKGGGSIINNRWILTAAHVLMLKNGYWCRRRNLLAFVGISERPGKDGVMNGFIEAYALENYFPHVEFSSRTYVNDIALIKVGAKLNPDLTKVRGMNNGLTFKHHIRPVCLPCTGSCMKREHIVDANSNSLITDKMSDKSMCQVEGEFLLSDFPKAMVTGFGHMDQSDEPGYNVSLAKKLQQGLLKIEDDAFCKNGTEEITRKSGEDVQFTENMICCTSGIIKKNTDACQGDSGGPLLWQFEHPVVKGNNNMNKSCWIQIGIVTFGYGCGSGLPGYYTNVARYISWINETTGGSLQGHVLDCEDGFFYGGRCYFTVMTIYTESTAETLCISNGGRLADILDKHHQKLVDADVRGKISSDSAYVLTGMKYQHSTRTVRSTDGSRVDIHPSQWRRGFPSGNAADIKLKVYKDEFYDDGLYNYRGSGGDGVLCRK